MDDDMDKLENIYSFISVEMGIPSIKVLLLVTEQSCSQIWGYFLFLLETTLDSEET